MQKKLFLLLLCGFAVSAQAMGDFCNSFCSDATRKFEEEHPLGVAYERVNFYTGLRELISYNTMAEVLRANNIEAYVKLLNKLQANPNFDINAPDEKGKRLIHYPTNDIIIEDLRKHGADFLLPDAQGKCWLGGRELVLEKFGTVGPNNVMPNLFVNKIAEIEAARAQRKAREKEEREMARRVAAEAEAKPEVRRSTRTRKHTQRYITEYLVEKHKK